jgi:hypothetical protein
VYALECVLKANEVGKNLSRRRLSGSHVSKTVGGNGSTNDENLVISMASATPQTTTATCVRSITGTALSSQQGTCTPSINTKILSNAAQATKSHAAKVGLDGEALDNRLGAYARRATSAVCVTVSACTKYNICTIDPDGDEMLDTWAKIDANFSQSFRVTGGPNGRIIRGEETVQVTVTGYGDKNANNGVFSDDSIPPNRTSDVTILQHQQQVVQNAITTVNNIANDGVISPMPAPNATSPPSNRGRMNRLVFLRFGSSDDLEQCVGDTTSDGAVS